MREFIGVVSWLELLSEFPSLKQEALMFDRLTVSNLNGTLNTKRQFGTSSKHYVDELKVLIDWGIVFEAPETPPNLHLFSNQDFLKYADSMIKQQSHVDKLVTGIDALNPLDERRIGYLADYLSKLQRVADSHVRATSVQLRILNNFDAHPVVSTELHKTQDPQIEKSDVIQIIFNAMPVPNESTSWEQIMEYRSDPDSKAKFLDLRNWMNEVARATLTPIEFEQKLEHLMSQYQRHMALHKMKTNAGTLETYLTIGAEVLEELLHLKPSKAVKALFSLKHRRIALMEGELTSPGSEVAYIIKARKKFPN